MKTLAILAILCLGSVVEIKRMEGSLTGSRPRNLAEYNNGGVYDFDTADYDARSRWEQQIRSFLWLHWTGKRLGYLRATYYTKEGDSIATTYYVEPEPKGLWTIFVEEDRNFRGERIGEPRRVEHRKYRIYKLKKVRGSKAATYRVVLLDQLGKTLGEL